MLSIKLTSGIGFSPLPLIVLAAIVVATVFIGSRLRRTPRGQASTMPSDDPVSFVGGGRWSGFGRFIGLDVGWPLVQLTVGRDSLYYGPNMGWPLWRMHAVPVHHLLPGEIISASLGPWGVYLRVESGETLVFGPVFTSASVVLEAIASRGYRTSTHV
jgi:hypothetical protein